MIPFKTTLLAAATALIATAATAHEFKIGALKIDHPYSFATPPTAKSGAGYLTITNTGDMPDRLMGARANFARTMIHKSEMVDGVMKMSHQMGGILIPAGESISLEPGGLHVMFVDLEGPFKEGETNSVTLIFKNAGQIDVDFKIEKRGDKGTDHFGHSN